MPNVPDGAPSQRASSLPPMATPGISIVSFAGVLSELDWSDDSVYFVVQVPAPEYAAGALNVSADDAPTAREPAAPWP
jgi:hypothetical protein